MHTIAVGITIRQWFSRSEFYLKRFIQLLFLQNDEYGRSLEQFITKPNVHFLWNYTLKFWKHAPFAQVKNISHATCEEIFSQKNQWFSNCLPSSRRGKNHNQNIRATWIICFYYQEQCFSISWILGGQNKSFSRLFTVSVWVFLQFSSSENVIDFIFIFPVEKVLDKHQRSKPKKNVLERISMERETVKGSIDTIIHVSLLELIIVIHVAKLLSCKFMCGVIQHFLVSRNNVKRYFIPCPCT